MKKYLSVFLLPAHSLRWVALLLLGLAAAEGGVFWMNMQGIDLGLEQLLADSGLVWFYLGAVILLEVLLCAWTYSRGRMHPELTLRRLRVSEEATVLCFALYNALCFLLLAAAQLGIILLLGRWYGSLNPALVNEQTMLLACYRHDLFRCLLPLHNSGRMFVNLLLWLAQGLAAAMYSYSHRRRRSFNFILVFACYRQFYYGLGYESLDVLIGLMALAGLLTSLWSLWRGYRDAKAPAA